MKIKTFQPQRAGFTLLEVLVATAILALIVVVLAAMASEASRIWKSTEAFNQRRSTGRALMQFIARDLEMASLPIPYPPGNASGPNLQFVANVSGQIPSDLLNPHAAFWHAPIAADQSRGDLASIGYFVRWDTTSMPGTAKAQLCRFLVDPADTSNYQVYEIGPEGAPANWLDISTLNRVAPASEDQEYRGWFADNVIAFWLRCLDSQGNPILKCADGTTLNGGYGFDSRRGFESSSSAARHPAPALPDSVEIAIVTVDSHTAKKISAPLLATPNSPENFWKDKTTPGSVAHFVANLPSEIQPGIQVFSTRIPLKNAHRTP